MLMVMLVVRLFLMCVIGSRLVRLGLGFCFLYRFMLMVWYIMLLFRNIRCICGLFLVVWVLVRMLVELLGIMVILMLYFCLKGLNIVCVKVFFMLLLFMLIYSVWVCVCIWVVVVVSNSVRVVVWESDIMRFFF